MQKCHECGQIIEEKVSNCPNCGCPIEKETIEEQDKLEKINTPSKNLSVWKKITFLGMVIFAIASGVFYSKADYVKNEYYNSDSFYSLNKNAYVGGDAYNYIINGTYFTGYSVIGTGCMMCAVIMGTSFITLKVKE